LASAVKQVFISCATEDTDFAHRLADDLKRLRARVWIAPDSILAGESWLDAIERGLSESSHVVMVLTPAALEASGVKMERDMAITLALQDRIKVLSLRVKPCEVPLVLSRYQMILAFEEDYEAGLNQLARVLSLSVAQPATLEREPFESELIHIPAGEFLMGSDPNKDKVAYDEEQPQHRLYLPDYHIARTPITNAQYSAFVEANRDRQPKHWKSKYAKAPRGKEDHPVVKVTWHDAMAYCQWLAKVTGKPYRLPSEAEWEKAARGTDGRIWPWGDDAPDESQCNFGANAGGTTPVGMYSPEGDSPYGCVDMAGNVYEWCATRWGKSYPYDVSENEWSSDYLQAAVLRVLRGGSWFSLRDYARCACRHWYVPHFRSGYFCGFRVVSPI
jgi:formylglycine-generating enzyme required for sulfatase activity